MRTACAHETMTLIAPNFHIYAPYLPNNFYSTNQALQHRHIDWRELFGHASTDVPLLKFPDHRNLGGDI